MGIFINLLIWIFQLVFQLFIILARCVIELLAHLFGGAFQILADRMREKKPAFGKKGGLFKKKECVYNTLADALNEVNPLAQARNIGIFREGEDENIDFEIEHAKMKEFLVACSNIAFKMSPVSISIYCKQIENGYQFGVHAMNVPNDQSVIENLQFAAANNDLIASQLAEELGATFSISQLINDVYIYAELAG